MLGLIFLTLNEPPTMPAIWHFGVAIQESQLVAVVRFSSFLGTTMTNVYSNDGKLVDSEPPVPRNKIRFDVALDCTGSAPDHFDFIVPAAAGPYATPWSGTQIHWGPGDLGLVFCNRVGSNGRWQMNDETYIQVDPGTYISVGFPDMQEKLPDISYVREGSTAVQRLISVFAQAYAADPNKNEWYLHDMRSLLPGWAKNKDGSVRITEDGFKDSNVFSFFLERVYPRLVRAAGNDPVKKLRAEWYSCCAGNPANNARYKEMLDDLERTYPKPDERHLVEGIAVPDEFDTREFWLSKTCSRLATVRAISLAPNHIKNERQNISRVLEMLDDSSEEVLERAVDWLRHMKDDHYDLYKDAPNIQFNGHIIKNKSEVIEYWSGR